MVGIAARLPRMFQNTLNTMTQRNRKYTHAQIAAQIMKAYLKELRKRLKTVLIRLRAVCTLVDISD